MKDETRKLFGEVLEAIFQQMEEDQEECVLDEYEITINILQEGADILQSICPGLRIKAHRYSTTQRFELSISPQREEQVAGLGDIVGPTIPQGESEDSVTNIIRQIRTKLRTDR